MIANNPAMTTGSKPYDLEIGRERTAFAEPFRSGHLSESPSLNAA